jgi:peptide deformylase
MIELMRDANGIGLAAPQVGLSWRLFVIDIPPGEDRDPDASPPTATHGPIVYINPQLSEPARSVEIHEEGCLSLPDIHGDVIRPTDITVTATDLAGQPFTHRATGLLARCVQHEFDHIDGVLILDRMIQTSRARVRAAVRDLERRAGIR